MANQLSRSFWKEVREGYLVSCLRYTSPSFSEKKTWSEIDISWNKGNSVGFYSQGDSDPCGLNSSFFSNFWSLQKYDVRSRVCGYITDLMIHTLPSMMYLIPKTQVCWWWNGNGNGVLTELSEIFDSHRGRMLCWILVSGNATNEQQ